MAGNKYSNEEFQRNIDLASELITQYEARFNTFLSRIHFASYGKGGNFR